MSRLVEVGEIDKAAVREEVYGLLVSPVPEISLAASELVVVLLLDAAEQHAKVGRGLFWSNIQRQRMDPEQHVKIGV